MLMLMLFSHKGFHTRKSIWKSPYENLGGNALNIVMPNISLIFSQLYKYPNKSQVRTGGDYLAALYLGEALNFKPKYDDKVEPQSECYLCCLSFRVMNITDGKWGSLVDKETNSFNGMIGMVQRKVKKLCFS